MNDSIRFIIKPVFGNLKEKQLNYKDTLVYLSIRSFYNSKDKYCFPSYKTISNRSGFSVKFISESVKRLETAGLLDIWKVGKKSRVSHCYKFPDVNKHIKVPFTFLEAKELNSNEKAMLLLLSEHFDENRTCSKSIVELESLTGATARTIRTHYSSLVQKGYLGEEYFPCTETHELLKKVSLTDKIIWNSQSTNSKNTISKVEDSSDRGTAIVSMALNMLRSMHKGASTSK